MGKSREQRIREAFALFDLDGNGSISREELREVLTRQGGGAPLSQQDAQEIIEEFDENGDGELQIEEVCDACLPPSFSSYLAA
jgi:Ca2+-binding EF-hand superfamily protein